VYACYLKNRSPTRTLNGKTPHEVLWGKKPNLTTVHEFGSKIWVLKPDTNLDKLDPHPLDKVSYIRLLFYQLGLIHQTIDN
jgi:hypothetical protein